MKVESISGRTTSLRCCALLLRIIAWGSVMLTILLLVTCLVGYPMVASNSDSFCSCKAMGHCTPLHLSTKRGGKLGRMLEGLWKSFLLAYGDFPRSKNSCESIHWHIVRCGSEERFRLSHSSFL